MVNLAAPKQSDRGFHLIKPQYAETSIRKALEEERITQDDVDHRFPQGIRYIPPVFLPLHLSRGNLCSLLDRLFDEPAGIHNDLVELGALLQPFLHPFCCGPPACRNCEGAVHYPILFGSEI